MKEKLAVVKIGGNVIDDQLKLQDFVRIFSQLEGKKLLIHGGGKIATQTAERLNIETQMIDGRRITGDDMIDVAVMVYAGLVNKNIIAMLSSKGVTSIGLSGADGNSILAGKRPVVNGIDYGWVGDVKQVNADLFDLLLKSGITPVMCALTHDGQGQMLNTNADTVASEIAIALSSRYEVDLNYCFELPGVLRDMEDFGTLIKEIRSSDYEKLKVEGVISGGMIPKLDNAFDSLSRGVARVNIRNVESLAVNQNHEFTTLY